MSSILSSWTQQKPTHTSKLLLGLLSTIIIVSGAFADPDIAPSASTADCKYAPLETYSGTSNLQAGWQPNTIALHWYNGDTELTVPSASQSCTYDGTLTPPATIPTKTGYTFKGWRVKQGNSGGQQAQQCTFASSVCGLTGGQVDSISYYDDWDETDGYAAYDFNSTYLHSNGNPRYASYSGEPGDWLTLDENDGLVRGIASCNSTAPNTTLVHWYLAVSDQAVYSYANSDVMRPGNAFSKSNTGRYCWCKMTSYTPSGGETCNTSNSCWVYLRGGTDCGDYGGCAIQCAMAFTGGGEFRRAIWSVSQ